MPEPDTAFASAADAAGMLHSSLDHLMGIWQVPLLDHRVIEPLRSDRGLACWIDASLELGNGMPAQRPAGSGWCGWCRVIR